MSEAEMSEVEMSEVEMSEVEMSELEMTTASTSAPLGVQYAAHRARSRCGR
jgi:hypothetical protein